MKPRIAGRVAEPFPHLEPGSWNAILGSEAIDGAWQDWDGLAGLAREAIKSRTIGPFDALLTKLPVLAKYVEAGRAFGKPPSVERP